MQPTRASLKSGSFSPPFFSLSSWELRKCSVGASLFLAIWQQPTRGAQCIGQGDNIMERWLVVICVIGILFGLAIVGWQYGTRQEEPIGMCAAADAHCGASHI